MNLKRFILTIILMCSIGCLKSQVGINTAKPNPKAGLHVSERSDPASTNLPDKYNGVIIQRYTMVERDANFSPTATEDGLLIYNTTEKCYNYWNSQEATWKSICGDLGKATLSCTSTLVSGAYVQGKPLTNSNFISITLNVTKAGSYNITGITNNGYNFSASGNFLAIGTYTIVVIGQGKPIAAQSDNVTLTINGAISSTCVPAVTVFSSSGTYGLSCGAAIVNGVYSRNIPLTVNNTITLPVTVTSLGSWSINTNTVDGISFSGSGTFASTGNQNLTLNGSGIPTSTADKIITITANSADGTSTCSVTVCITIPGKKIIGIGIFGGTYGYHLESSGSSAMYNSSANFGTLATSTVKYNKATAIYTNYTEDPTDANFNAYLATKPDIVIIGYYMNWSISKANAMVNYLNNKGTCIMMQQDPANASLLFQALYGDNTISFSAPFGGGSIYQLSSVNDPILNGPFGDARGKLWGEDAGGGSYLTNIPAGSITNYSAANPITSTNTFVGVSAFRDNTHNFIFFGDGGFISNPNNTTGPAGNGSQVICPFAIDSNGKPIARTGYGNGGNGTVAGAYTVYNSIVFANALAWAIKQAEFNGINTK
ncbi:autotransporter outer membrane beta-barrel domain-containing protein [Chryseobacterium culicis]|uniref:Uncharacterized protein n=1 Tax=Chryseobacterium culicis TaxID=680127 RepID=A0A1H6H3F9_CHRCI|nr:hypothetical protein [Chryseobacterium culicis]SEH29802.1 hypothetical protein SAMN05421593_1185 [Chryseobacterium culicis]